MLEPRISHTVFTKCWKTRISHTVFIFVVHHLKGREPLKKAYDPSECMILWYDLTEMNGQNFSSSPSKKEGHLLHYCSEGNEPFKGY